LIGITKLYIKDDPRFKVTDIEFNMPQPSYTIDTLTYLEEKYPDKKFVLIAGSDQLPTFDKWKNPNRILEFYRMYVYARPGYKGSKYDDHPSVKIFNAPQMEISSTFIRKSIKEKKDMRYMLPPKVWNYMREMHFYEWFNENSICQIKISANELIIILKDLLTDNLLKEKDQYLYNTEKY